MLIIDAFVNHSHIDEIWVQNVGFLDDGICEYKIRKPEGDWPLISHKRSDGWRKLGIKVFEVLEEDQDEKFIKTRSKDNGRI